MRRIPKALISVITPAFDAAQCLPRAVASLRAQALEDWECVIVDDGSTDKTQELALSIDEPRIRLVCLSKNHGRAKARQIALENARGDYLCMLDADDWYYPDKLERQVEILRKHPELGTVSGGMAIVDEEHDLVGVRDAFSGGEGELRVYPPLRSVLSLNVFHAPSMIRMDLAKRCAYSPHLDRAEDFNFMAQVLAMAPYAVQASVHYAYSEPASIGREGLEERYRAARVAYWMLRRAYPVSGSLGVLKAISQAAMTRIPITRGIAERMFWKGTRPPSDNERSRHEAAKSQVRSALDGLDLH